MARRNYSYQQLFMDALGDAEKSAMGLAANKRAEAENTRADAESKARLGLVGEQTRGAKTNADKAEADYNRLLKEDSLRKSLGESITAQSDAQEGTPTATGHAVDFQAVKGANKDSRRADMALWNFMNPGNPMGAEQLAEKRTQDAKTADIEAQGKEFDLDEKGRESKRKDAESASLVGARAAQAEKDRRDANKPPKASELPIDVRSEVQALSGKTAGKKAIANQLASDLVQMRKAMGLDEAGNPIPDAKPNEDLAYSYAQNMLKTMNSKEGADAVGVDEAKRAAGLLEYNVADVKAGLGMKPGKFHGRDIPGFMKQVESNITGIRGAVGANQTEVDKLMGRTPASAAGGIDPNDPKVKAALAAGYSEDEIKAYLGKGKP